MGTVTQRHGHRKRLTVFTLILGGWKDVVMAEELKGLGDGERKS